MGQFFDAIPDYVLPWLLEQHLFWVATSPLSETGHVNVSPKGLEGSFHIIDKNTVWYEDSTGSGVETISHIKENKRVTLLFQAFEGPPRICRLFGQGEVHEFGTPEYDKLLPPEKRRPGSRSAIMVHIDRVGTSCGYGVPFYEFKCHRNLLLSMSTRFEKVDQDHADQPGSSGIASSGLKMYWSASNSKSIDGLPGVELAHLSDAVPRKGGLKYPRDNWKRFKTVHRGIDTTWVGLALTSFLLGILATNVFAKVTQG
jgi:hypothetical protein